MAACLWSSGSSRGRKGQWGLWLCLRATEKACACIALGREEARERGRGVVDGTARRGELRGALKTKATGAKRRTSVFHAQQRQTALAHKLEDAGSHDGRQSSVRRSGRRRRRFSDTWRKKSELVLKTTQVLLCPTDFSGVLLQKFALWRKICKHDKCTWHIGL